MRILYCGGCWDTNIGNAFIDYGCMELIKCHDIIFKSEKTEKIFGAKYGLYFNHCFDMGIDMAIFSGMVLCSTFFCDQKGVLDVLQRNNIPVVINGGGGFNYSVDEVNETKKLLRKYTCIKAIITRDDTAYSKYHDDVEFTYSGIDVAFFVPDIQKFVWLKTQKKIYNVINEVEFGNKSEIPYNDYVYTVHTSNSGKLKSKNWCSHSKILVSELPEEYIYLYAQTVNLCASRIHAGIIGLAFGANVKIVSSSPRKDIFYKVGCGGISNSYVNIDRAIIDRQKKDHKKCLERFINELR